MKIAWRLRMAAAQHEVWTGAHLRRLLAEKAGLKLSAVWPGQMPPPSAAPMGKSQRDWGAGQRRRTCSVRR
jgi:hypothetical protein